MTDYFGFLPSTQLNSMIDEATAIINEQQEVDYYPYRNALTKQIASELIDNLLVNLVEVIPNAERQEAMRKIVATVERATETLLGILLGKDKNEDILPSFYFLKQDAMFLDNEGMRRIGFQLDENMAQTIQQGFEATNQLPLDSDDKAVFKAALMAMNEAALNHFITKFTETLKLGMVKRKSIPVAKAAIDKGMALALNKLLPQLPDDGLVRLANFYRPYLIHIDKTAGKIT
ncbi:MULTISPECIES: hypothetical protein [Psychrobacter]|uniref:hypothetical protein n=1 Tax=Psychrobacter TaxID=497 RepID=UPI00146EC4E2|nr:MULTISPECIES: hypothetical protein [Psychrobacter]